MNNSAASVLIVDDQVRARQSLRALLATCPGLGEVREAGSGTDALEMIAASRPDVVIMDAHMPDPDGIATTRTIKTTWPEIRVIVLSLYADYALPAHTAGADAFVSKGDPAERLLAALSAADTACDPPSPQS